MRIFVCINTKDLALNHSIKNCLAQSFSITECINNADFIVLCGGDGTVLYMSHMLRNACFEKPIFAFNFGTCGYLCPFSILDFDHIVTIFSQPAYKLLPRVRPLLKDYGYFLNDVVITNKEPGHLNKFKLHISSGIYYTRADSIIVSTPCGSSGYNMSAGGPLSLIDSGCLIITAVSPYMSILKSIVVHASSDIDVYIEKASPRITVDGAVTVMDHVSIDGSKQSNLTFAEPEGYNILKRLLK